MPMVDCREMHKGMVAGHRHILVVEDDQETAGERVESLTANGYQVNLAANGSNALSLGVSANYAVITMDRMPRDTDGIAVMQSLRHARRQWSV